MGPGQPGSYIKSLIRLLQAIYSTDSPASMLPLSYIKEIEINAAIHRQDWQNVLDTLPASELAEVKRFDEYLAFVLEKFKPFTFL